VRALLAGLAFTVGAAACGGIKTGDDDTTAEATTTTAGAATSSTAPSTAAATTSPDARQNEDIVGSDVTVDPVTKNSSYCQQARGWARQNPFLASGYDPHNPAQLESAYRATAEHEHRLLDVAPPELAPQLALVSRQWDAVVTLFESAGWDYDTLVARPSPQVTATLQGDRDTQNAVSVIGDYDSRVCGVA
jgi:hypothetical protein